MPWITQETKAILASVLEGATPVDSICPCCVSATVAIQPRGIFSRMNDYTIFEGDIIPYGGYLQPSFLPQGVGEKPSCDHQKVTDVKILVCKWDEQPMSAATKMLVYNARVIKQQHQLMIDARYVQSGLLDISDMTPSHETITCGEIFAGGFSGWSHAVQAISSEVIPMKHIWTVDHDFMAVEMYTKSHANAVHLRSGHEANELRNCDLDEYNSVCKAFQCDIRTPWFLSHVKAGSTDIITWSPPCQPWSWAHTSQGFNKIAKHDQFDLVKKLIYWAGYEIISVKSINLREVIPQNRDRCIVIAVNRQSTRLNKIFTWEHWPILPPASLRVARVILPYDESTMQSMIPDPKILEMYFDRNLLPKSYDEGVPRNIGKKDLRKYRIRSLEDKCFACIMASYRKAHLLPESVIERGGRYGAFIYDGCVVRFLTSTEIFMMMGGITECLLPTCSDAQSHLLGNCISVPHATIAILNAIKILPGCEITFTVQEAFAIIMSKRIRADSVETIVQEDGIRIRSAYDSHLVIEPTIAIPLFITVTIKTPTTEVVFRVREGLKIMSVVSALLGPSMPQDMWIIMQNGSKLPLIESDVTQDSPLMLWANIPSKLFLDDGKFRSYASPFVVVLSHKGIVIQKRNMGHLVHQIIKTQVEFFHENDRLQDPYGICHDMMVECPDMVFCHPQGLDTRQLDPVVSLPKFRQCHGFLKMHGSWTTALKVVQFVKQSGLLHSLKTVGWTVYMAPVSGGNDTNFDVIIAPIMNQLSLPMQHMQMCVTPRLMVSQLPATKQTGENLRHVCFKLWDSWVWDGMVEPSQKVGIFTQAWYDISDFLGHPSELRIIIGGKNIMPEVTFDQFPQEKESLRMFAVLQLQGGGNKTDAMIEAKNHIAVYMLNQGSDLGDTTTMVDTMSRTCGLQSMKTIMQIQKDTDKLEAIKKWASTMHIRFPTINKKEENAQQKTKEWARQKKVQPHHQICANQMELIPEVFRNEDGSNPPIKNAISPGMSGVILMDAETAAPWISEHAVISSDECAIVVLGHQCPARDPSHCIQWKDVDHCFMFAQCWTKENPNQP